MDFCVIFSHVTGVGLSPTDCSDPLTSLSFVRMLTRSMWTANTVNLLKMYANIVIASVLACRWLHLASSIAVANS